MADLILNEDFRKVPQAKAIPDGSEIFNELLSNPEVQRLVRKFESELIDNALTAYTGLSHMFVYKVNTNELNGGVYPPIVIATVIETFQKKNWSVQQVSPAGDVFMFKAMPEKKSHLTQELVNKEGLDANNSNSG